MALMNTSELLELRKQFQDAYFLDVKYLWDSVKLTISVITILFSTQSVFMLWASVNSKTNVALIIIPIGILILCALGILNAKKSYRNIIEYVSCLAKVEDELDLSRKNKKDREFFKDDDNILCDRWIKNRKKYDTSEKFKEGSFKFNLKDLNSYSSIKLIYCFIIIFSIFLLSMILNNPYQIIH